jgi:DNA-directed RNA polymerase specialized sigma24 family protein
MEQRDWDWHAARRRCVSAARRVLRHREDAEEAAQEALLRAWRASDEDTAEDGTAEVVDEIAFRQTLSVLAPTEKQALVLRYVGDLTQKEVAHRLDVPEGTVKVRLHRGRKHLRELLEGSQ